MKRTREQIKAEPMKRIEEEVDKMLAWREGSAPPNLSQIEEEILKTRKGISQAMIEGMICGEESQGGRNTTGYVTDETGILCLSGMRGGLFPLWMSNSCSGTDIGVKGLVDR